MAYRSGLLGLTGGGHPIFPTRLRGACNPQPLPAQNCRECPGRRAKKPDDPIGKVIVSYLSTSSRFRIYGTTIASTHSEERRRQDHWLWQPEDFKLRAAKANGPRVSTRSSSSTMPPVKAGWNAALDRSSSTVASPKFAAQDIR